MARNLLELRSEGAKPKGGSRDDHDQTQTPAQIEGQAVGDHLGSPGRLVGEDPPHPPGLRAQEADRPANRQLAPALNGILFRMRTGCQWEQLPRTFGPKSTVHDWFQRWCAGGVMERIWAVLVQECDELGAVDGQGQSADAALGKARFGGEKGGPQSHRSRENGHPEVAAG
jgi:transposase